MLSVYRTLSTRYLARRWFRALLIVLCIALGVSTLVATRALSETMHRAGIQASNPLAGLADLLVSNGETPIDSKIAKELEQVEGVRSASPRIFTKVKLPTLENRSAWLVGLDVSEEAKKVSPDGKPSSEPTSLSDHFQIKYENYLDLLLFLPGGKGIAVGKELDKEIEAAGKKFEILMPGKLTPTAVTRAATIDAEGIAAVFSGNALFMNVQDVSQLLGHNPGFVDRIDIILEPDANIAEVRNAIRSVVQGRAEVATPEEQSKMVENVFASMDAGFSMCGVAALVVGMFLVYNALAVSVAERRHEIGVLMSVGATRSQVRWLFAGEAIILGIIGSILGIPLGIGIAYLGLQPVQGVLEDIFMAIDAKQVDVSLNVVVLAILAGTITALVAALVPAFQASNENPAEAVRRIPPKPTLHFRVLQITASVVIVLIGMGITALHGTQLQQTWQFSGMIMGLMIILTGIMVALPIFAAMVAKITQPINRQLMGIEGRLAADNLVRSPGRTGLVIAALASGVALVMQTAGVIRSNRLALRDWVDATITADLFVTFGSPVGASGQNEPMDASLANDLKKLPGVRAALAVRSKQVVLDNTRILMATLEAAEMARSDREDREINRIYEKLGASPGCAIVSKNFVALNGARDLIELPSPNGLVQLRVIGTIEDYSWNKGTIFINRSDYVKNWQDNKVDVFDVYLEDSANPVQVKETINRKLAAEHDLIVQTRSELISHIDSMIERLYGIAYAQLIVVFFIAALGVVTALLISVLQRRREMGLLRAIGASQVQVVRSVLAEAALMGVIGTVIGLLAGLPIEWYVLRYVLLEETGYLFPVYIPWTEALVIAICALTLATLAGLGPAIYAVRQRIPEAIAYE